MNSQEFRNLQEAYLDVYEGYRKLPVRKMMYKVANRVEREADTRAERERQADDPYSTLTYDRARKEHETAERNKERIHTMINVADTHSKKAAKAKSKLKKEQVDLYDLILSHLLDEGYADTQEGAEVIMVNMSEEWRESITEAYKKLPLGKMMRKVQKRATREADTRAELEYDPTFPTMKALKAAEKASRENKRSDTMINVADTHNEKQAKRKEEDNRRIGGRKRDAGRPRSNELQDNW